MTRRKYEKQADGTRKYVDLTVAEEAEVDAREATEATRIASEPYKTDLDDTYLAHRWPARKQRRLMYQLCKAIVPASRTQLMKDYIDDIDNVRAKREGS